ncbi:MAG: hypothetical protein KDE55_11955 [Novosphingobium sp.]|nr:hypothetical protein [Novosphingobium sp.]
MIIHPDLRALRGDDSPQRDAQAALYDAVGSWRETRPVADMIADIEAFATVRSLAECPALSALFDESDPAAVNLAWSFAQSAIAALGQAPLGHVPLRHFTDGAISTLLLARSGNVTLSIVAIDGEGLAGRPAPVTADFAPGEMWEHVLSGHARAKLVERRSATDGQADLRVRGIALAPGKVICRDGARQSLQLREVDGCLVSLRLQRRHANAKPTREYALADGRLVHQAAGNPRDSRVELMLALLGRMERTDAAPLLCEIAIEPGSTALRWQSLREALALDTSAGFAALTTIARSPEDALAPAAGALRAQLVEAHPQLEELARCRA